MANNLLNTATFIASLAICIRLLTYCPVPHARHRPGVGWCAWLLIICTGGQALQILLFGSRTTVSIWQLGVLLVLLVVTYRARGNVARLLRVD